MKKDKGHNSMIYKKILLQDINQEASPSSYLELFIHEDMYDVGIKRRPSMVVVPGGGYGFVAPLESETVALTFMAEGFNAFIVTYEVNKAYPAPHRDLTIAVNYIKEREDEYHSDGHLFLVGFSAGGHLIGSYSYLYPELAAKYGYDQNKLRPDAIIMAYPVITFDERTHQGTKDILTGGDNSLIDKFSIHKHITKDYPPTFVWTTLADTIVDPVNTELMKEALNSAGIKNEVYSYDVKLDHGLSVVTMENKCQFLSFNDEELLVKRWPHLAVNFITKIFYK